jgi:anti-sigma B factor antagonist
LLERARGLTLDAGGHMQIHTRNVGPVVFLDLKGRLVLDQEGLVRNAVAGELTRGCRQFVLNLKEVTAMDTTGLSTMLWVKLTVIKQGGEVKLINLPSRIRDLLVITRLITMFDVMESEAAAMTSFAAMVA